MATQSSKRTTIGTPSASSQAREASKAAAAKMDPKKKLQAIIAGGVLLVSVCVIGYVVFSGDGGPSELAVIPPESTTISVTNSCEAEAKVTFKVDGSPEAAFKGESGKVEAKTTNLLPGQGQDLFELGDQDAKPGTAPAEMEVTVLVNGETATLKFTMERKRRASLAFHDAGGSLRIETGPGIVKKE